MMAIRKRVAILLVGVVAAFLCLSVRLAYLQIARNAHLLDLALDQRLRPIPILPHRGAFYDRNMNPLAISVSSQSAYAIPVEVRDPRQTALKLSPILDEPFEDLLERLSRRQAMVWLKVKLDPLTARRLRELALPGVGVVERPARFYPHGRLAAQVLGFVGIDNQGLEGLEAFYDTRVRGAAGMIVRERDAQGRVIPGGIERRIPPTDGEDLVLTIDQVIQYIGERELEKAVLETQSELGLFVAVQPKTGEILAMAAYPTFDPNQYADFAPALWRNRVVADQFEPGSTFKIVTGASALEAGVTRLDEVFNAPGVLHRWGGAVHDWLPGGHGTVTFVQATEGSVNPIFAILGADRLGPEQFYKYASAFGFGEPLGVDLPGEAGGNLPKPGEVKYGEQLRWANIGFGQGVAVTPLQLVMAAATIANRGVLMRPHLVREVRDAENRVVERVAAQASRQVLSEKTAVEFARVMRSVVVNGSGKRADVRGFRVAGKTGTAQIPGPTGGYLANKNMASFVGFAPVDDPEIAAVVMLYKVGVYPAWGGLWAAPLFGAVIGPALEHLGVERQTDPDGEAGSEGGESAKAMIRVPDVRQMERDQAAALLSQQGLVVADEGMGDRIFDQTPKPGAVLPAGATVLLIHYESERAPGRGEAVAVPNLTGRSLRDAADLLAEIGLRIRIEGTGFAAWQAPAPGTRVPPNTPVRVRFAPRPTDGRQSGETMPGADVELQGRPD